jgi:hypothetical protein
MTTWTGRTKPTTDYDKRNGFLLCDTGYLLIDGGARILLSGVSAPTFTNRTKPATAWT